MSANYLHIGLATAAGCQLVASCDIAVASTKSQFATPGLVYTVQFVCILAAAQYFFAFENVCRGRFG